MKLQPLVLGVVLGVLVAFGAVFLSGGMKRGDVAPQNVVKETRLEQVKRTGVLRCGYTVWPPFLTKDPNTGKMGGAVYELVEEMGKLLSVKIDWTAEVATGQIFSDLSLNRYDMVCSIFAATPGRAREGDFVGPIFYSPLYMYVRKDDTRFDADFDIANRPEMKFAALDGEGSSLMASEMFPAASKVSVPQYSTSADLYMMVANKKADAVLQDPFTFADYAAQNPGVLKAAGNRSFRVFSLGMPIPGNEPALKAALSTTLAYLHDGGFVDRLLKKYDGDSKFIRVAKPYAP